VRKRVRAQGRPSAAPGPFLRARELMDRVARDLLDEILLRQNTDANLSFGV